MDHLNPVRYDNAIPTSSHMEGASKKQKFFIPLRRTELTGLITGPVSEFTTVQTFHFTKDECADTVDAIYRFPLPGDAAIESVKAFFGDNEVESKLMERQKAELEFESAKKKGKQSLLMTKESPDVFTLFLAGIKPGEEVKVHTKFVQVGDSQGVGFEFRIPLTTSPRYVRGDEAGGRQANAQPLLPMIDPGHRFSMSVRSDCPGGLDCTSFETQTSSEGKMSLKAGEVVPDRDLVLRWTPVQGKSPTVQVISDKDKHFIAVVTPPKRPKELRPREIILLLDRSGSMAGPKEDATTWTAERLIRSLRPGDRFNLCIFHSKTKWLFERPEVISEGNRKLAMDFLKLAESGGTELGLAVEQALSQKRIEDLAVGHVIVITDAEVSDAARIVHTVKERRQQRMCSVICIDSAPNSFLAKRIARVGQGASKFLTSSPAEKDMTTALDEIMEEWMAPISGTMSLMTGRPAIDSENGKYKLSKKGEFTMELPPVPSGRSVVILGAFKTKGKMDFRCVSSGAEGIIEDLTVNQSSLSTGALKHLFGAAMINMMEMTVIPVNDIDPISEMAQFGLSIRSGSERLSVYPENLREAEMKALKEMLIRMSLQYNVPCTETAFLGIRKEEGSPSTKLVIVPNALGQGWSDEFAHDVTLNSRRRSPADLNCCFSLSSGPVRQMAYAGPDRLDVSEIETLDIELPNGFPDTGRSEIVLLDDSRHPVKKISGLMTKVTINGAGLEALEMQIFVGDMSTARVRIRLRDMEDGVLERPVNILVNKGERVMIKLVGFDRSMVGIRLRVVFA